MRSAKAQQRPPAHKGNERQQRAYHHARAGCQRSCPDAPAQHAQEQEFQCGAQHAHQDVEQHAAADIAADAQKIIHCEYDRGHGGTDRVYADVLHRKFGKFSLRAHELDEQRRRPIQQHADRGACAHDHQTGAGKDITRFPLFLSAQVDRDGNRGAKADQVGKRKVDDDKRHGQIDRRKGGRAQILADEHAVDRLVERGGQHTDCPGDRGDEKQFDRGGPGK